MIKLIALLISFILSLITIILIPTSFWYYKVLLFILFTIIYIIVEIIIFFIPLIYVQLFIKGKEPNKHYSKNYRRFYVVYTSMLLSLFSIKLKIKNKQNIPNDTCVIVHNHLSNLDPIILNVYFKNRPLVFMAKKSLKNIPFFGKILQNIGYLFLERNGSPKDAIAIKHALRVLRNDIASVGIAPEGTRNFTNEVLLPFKDGSFLIALKSNKPLLISVLKDTNKVNDKLLFKKHIVEIDFVSCIPYDEYKDLSVDELSKKVYDIMYQNLTNN